MRFALALSAALAAYNNAFNAVVPSSRAYVPVNLAATAGVLAAGRRAGLRWEELGFDSATAPRGVRAGLALGAGVAAGLAVALVVIPRRLRDERVRDLTGRGAAYQALVRIPLGTALWEETAFRGVLYAAWRCVLPRRWAAVASSAVFGLWHVVPTWQAARQNDLPPVRTTVAGVVLTAVGGLGFCELRDRTGSIWAPVIVHASTNSLGTVVGHRAWRLAEDRR